MKFESNGNVINGFLGGDSYNVINGGNMSSLLQVGTNEVIIAVRNLGKVNDRGGISFRMDINCDDSSVKQKSSDLTSDIGLIVYPNPARDLLTIYSELAISELKLYDISGKLTLQQSHDAEKEVLLDIRELAQAYTC